MSGWGGGFLERSEKKGEMKMIKTIEFKQIDIDRLTTMDEALSFPTDADDRAPIDVSMEEDGQIQPLIVRETSKGYYEIIDGIGRWEAAKKLGYVTVECKVVACDYPRMIVLASNCAGRKRSVGSRVLAYMEMHKREVLKAAKVAQLQQSVGGGGNDSHSPIVSRLPGLPILDAEYVMETSDIPSEFKPFTQKGVAEALGVDRKTVREALRLLICREVGCDNNGDDLEEGGEEMMSLTFDRVLKGETPVNRWPAAFQGKRATAGEGKAEINYPKLALNTATSLQTVLTGWHDIEWPNRDRKEEVEALLAQSMAMLPEACRAALIDLIPQAWAPQEKNALAKAIKESCK